MKQDTAQLKILTLISTKTDFMLPKRKNNQMAKALERAVKAGLVKKNVKKQVVTVKKKKSFTQLLTAACQK